MNLNELVGWYQNTISKYDRNKWDESVEQMKINELGKATKQKAKLIDVDLVRGSTFPKAKPKQHLFTVVGLASLRLLFLPIHKNWWAQQTSRTIYKFLLTLYVLQVFNAGMYIYITTYGEEEHIVTMRDTLIPNLLSLLLSIIHSQIVATACTSTSSKRPIALDVKKRRLKQRMPRRKSKSATSHIEKRTNLVVDRNEPISGSAFKIRRNNSTNCPNGLRKRNVDFNHIFSPYWVKKDRLDSTESAEERHCDETIQGSERSNIDHGFVSFNGKSSSSEGLATTHVNGPSQGPSGDQYLNFKQNLLCSSKDVDDDLMSSPIKRQFNTVLTSPWLGVTSNSESSYSSGSESDSMLEKSGNSIQPTQTLTSESYLKHASSSDKISCTLWHDDKTTKVEMSMMAICTAITQKVESMKCSYDYIYIGVLLSVLLALVPVICRVCEAAINSTANEFNIQGITTILLEKASISKVAIIKIAFGKTISEALLLSIALILRFCLILLFFFLLAVAERTFKQRLLYAKLFSHLTSSRRANKSKVPHFRLSKLRNIKTWLSVRSYLKKRGPQRSVDVIVSAAFVLCLVFVSFLCAESLNDSVQQHWQYDLEVFMWSCSLGCFILRFMTLGTAINDKYRSVSILITEQINLYLKMEQNPEKKDKLSAANSVLKLASDLLKEIELPFKISGFNINPYLSAGIRVLIVSALSGACSELLGFKLKLFKLKET